MTARLRNLGTRSYLESWKIQKEVCQEVQEGAPDTLILVQHPAVMTLGAAFQSGNLLLRPADYEAKGIEIVTTDRGGDVTLHNPGQLVVYPIFNLENHGRDLHLWMRQLEETMIQVCAKLGIDAGRRPPNTGCWIGDLKVASMGVKVKKWVSLHGIALNCCNDLSPFGLIIPCGIPGRPMTSLSQILGREVSVSEAAGLTVLAFEEVFSLTFSQDKGIDLKF